MKSPIWLALFIGGQKLNFANHPYLCKGLIHVVLNLTNLKKIKLVEKSIHM
ncbi:hypothetical protein MS2017_2002 [Bathymodiolus thermophilus thioautotrophic gill symbiont]|uniref:Uncharacterized protein n=1 Tax=Bathymodiolus thermophilus thioautotrophic gill symbiont TaxID=2360 RepID=A0A3G3IPE8_9GAMM|nr:hypothetical protein MS2017_2002 [Bathymodiolus thermophilus thioautotrophic gill symbiont]